MKSVALLMRHRAARRAAGLCPKCGKRAPPPGRVECSECRARDQRWERGSYQEARSAGCCMRCGALSGRFAQCLACRKKRCEKRQGAAA